MPVSSGIGAEWAMASRWEYEVRDTCGMPLFIVLNAGSGNSDADEAVRKITCVLEAAGRAHHIIRPNAAMGIEQAARYAAPAARRSGGVLVAAGGDGTLNAVARAALDHDCLFGVIPQGTFNYFARAHGIPHDASDAARGLLTTRIRRVSVGLVNEQLFLVNASVGLYPEALEARERQQRRHGRGRAVALWTTLRTLLGDHRPMRLRIEVGQEVRELSTLTLFAGLNQLQLEQAGLDPKGPPAGLLTAVVLQPVSPSRRLWLMIKGAVGGLQQDHGVETFRFSRLTVTPANPRAQWIKVAADGETRWMTPPLQFRLAPEPLRLLVPDDVSDTGQVRD